MNARRRAALLASLSMMLMLPGVRAADPPLYQNDFEKAALGEVPEDFLIMDGLFEVREEEGNRFLELPGAPLGTFGLLFGTNALDGVAVSARIYATNVKRRYPAFGVGLNNLSGHRLMVAPAKRQLELYKGDTKVLSQDFTWKPGTWTRFHLQLRKVKEGEWKVEGKVWPDGQPAPAEWTLQWTDSETPYAGKPSIWGKPYSGTPIRFDDLKEAPVHK